ncbi:MAG: hypothetical protein U5N56_06510 [Candidatus Marinimicrobia bacterium]|nr:hypothetical protein [Candidatus Neomarinimicrobiota bacterium]
MKNDVAIYGGFEGTEDLLSFDFDNRDFESNETVLSGYIYYSMFNIIECYHVFYHPSALALDETAILDGFTVTGGKADGSYPHSYGAGMYNYSCSPTIKNVKFDQNTAAQMGGGMYNYYASPHVSNVTFSSNSVTGQNSVGGGCIIISPPRCLKMSYLHQIQQTVPLAMAAACTAKANPIQRSTMACFFQIPPAMVQVFIPHSVLLSPLHWN